MDGALHDEVSFLHFNDVYHIAQPTVLGRFAHVFRQAKTLPEAERPITIFSGDAFSPSLESSVMKGEHMVPVLNHLLIDVACYGNHDFDFGEDALVKLSQSCSFPWLLANAVHADGRLLATAEEHLVLEKRGYKIGFFGLAGTDWPSNCQHLPADCTILDPVSVARRVSHTLRSTHRVDFVIAITHMRHEEDILLAKSCQQEVDLILGGHDHDLAVHGASLTMINGIFEGDIKVIKSGTDFRNYSDIKMTLSRRNGKAVIERVKVFQMPNISVAEDVPDDNGVREILDHLRTNIAAAVDSPLFYTTAPLDGRTSVIRTEETNIGNMVADAVRAYYNADIAFINSGSLRCDRIIEAGVVTVKDVIEIVPFDNTFVVKRLSGRTIITALENAACDVIDGRFLQVSGISFCIESHQPAGSRIHGVYLAPDHTCGAPTPSALKMPLDDDNEYTVAMVAFIAEGFDDYTLFKDTPTLVGEEGGMSDSSLLMQVFQGNAHTAELDKVHEDQTDVSIRRARAAIIVGTTAHGLPLVNPSVQGRIKYIRRHTR
ncbi:Metallo-dependent phosphatase-like protein [Melanogaster broomeanus]|nr:Metallo-dependent phosphatase-like protein [Melanogaster broomeanus]